MQKPPRRPYAHRDYPPSRQLANDEPILDLEGNPINLPNNILFGRHPILEALQNGQYLDKIFLQRGIQREFAQQIIALARLAEIPLQEVPPEKLNRLTTKNHQGIVAFAPLITYYKVEDLLADAYESGQTPLFLICDGITDVGNFGAMVRTALCSGVHGIVITAKGSAAIHAEAIKASAGALLQARICRVRFLDTTIELLQQSGLQVVATALAPDAKFIHEIDLTQPTAIIMGAEGKGVSPKHLSCADIKAKIPMMGNFNSFNVSVATGMVLYETMRQRIII